jgi:hypothetical protein
LLSILLLLVEAVVEYLEVVLVDYLLVMRV